MKTKVTARDKAAELACRYPSCPGPSRHFQSASGEAEGGFIDTAWPACFRSQALLSMMMVQFINCVKSAVLYQLSYPEYSGTGFEPATPRIMLLFYPTKLPQVIGGGIRTHRYNFRKTTARNAAYPPSATAHTTGPYRDPRPVIRYLSFPRFLQHQH